MSLLSYEGLVTNGKIRLKGNPHLPDGTRLVVVVTEQPAWVSRGLTEVEWRKPFEEFITTAQSATPAPLEEEPLSDTEINASIHAARRERHAQGPD